MEVSLRDPLMQVAAVWVAVLLVALMIGCIILIAMRCRKKGNDVEAAPAAPEMRETISVAEAVDAVAARWRADGPPAEGGDESLPVALAEDVAAELGWEMDRECAATLLWALRRHGAERVSRGVLLLGMELCAAYARAARISERARWADLEAGLTAGLHTPREYSLMRDVALACGSTAVSFADLLDMSAAIALWRRAGADGERAGVDAAARVLAEAPRRSDDHRAVLEFFRPAGGLLFGDLYFLYASVRAWNAFDGFDGGALPSMYAAQFAAHAGLPDDDASLLAEELCAICNRGDLRLVSFHVATVLWRLLPGARAQGRVAEPQRRHLLPFGAPFAGEVAPDASLGAFLRANSPLLSPRAD